MTTEGNETLSGERAIESTEVKLKSCTPENYMLLTSVMAINLIFKKIKEGRKKGRKQ